VNICSPHCQCNRTMQHPRLRNVNETRGPFKAILHLCVGKSSNCSIRKGLLKWYWPCDHLVILPRSTQLQLHVCLFQFWHSAPSRAMLPCPYRNNPEISGLYGCDRVLQTIINSFGVRVSAWKRIWRPVRIACKNRWVDRTMISMPNTLHTVLSPSVRDTTSSLPGNV
jgi:hypothetical protein